MSLRGCLAVLMIMISDGCWAGGDARVEAAQQDLAKRLQVPLKRVNVVSQIEKTWPDGSLGCPRKGMMYKQVLTNGTQLILSAGGKQYSYHAALGKAYFYCPLTQKKKKGSSGSPMIETKESFLKSGR